MGEVGRSIFYAIGAQTEYGHVDISEIVVGCCRGSKLASKTKNNQYPHANVGTNKHDLFWALNIFKIPINWFAFGI